MRLWKVIMMVSKLEDILYKPYASQMTRHVANTVRALQRLMDALDKTPEEFGMRINIKKTKVMVISKRDTQRVEVIPA